MKRIVKESLVITRDFLSISFLVLFLSLLFSCSAVEHKEDTAPSQAIADIQIDKKVLSVRGSGTPPKVFDDVGSALIWRENLPCMVNQVYFDINSVAFDFFTGEEIPLMDALYIHGTAFKTPKGYDIVAFKNRENAERFLSVNGDGKILTYEDLLRLELK